MSQGDFFEEDGRDAVARDDSVARKRRRTRTIALVALGGVTAFGVYSCIQVQEEQRLAQQGEAGAGNANGQTNRTHYRPSFFPWFWMMSRGSSPAPMPGATSGFNAGGGTATAGRTGAATGGASSTSTSRGGFGAFGRALSGLS